MASSEDRIRECISALGSATTDTERFAALLLVPRVLEASKCSEEDRKRLFEAVGFGFVSRLIASDDVPAGCPPHLFRGVALSVLAAFCTVPELVASERMADKVPRFLEVLTERGFSKEERAMKNDALTCLLSLTAEPESCRAIVDSDGMSKLCDVYAVDDARHNFKEQLFSVISSVASQLGPECWRRRPEAFHVLMNALARRLLDEERSQRKFVLCDVIRGVFRSFPAAELRESCAAEPWYGQFNEELLGILCFKLGEAQREPLLKLCSTLTAALGAQWALGANEKSLRMFYLLVQLSCVEVRMITEERNFEEVMRKSELAAACFAVLEAAIRFLIEDDGQVVNEKSQQQLYAALTGAFAAVLGFLRLVLESEEEEDGEEPRAIAADPLVAVSRKVELMEVVPMGERSKAPEEPRAERRLWRRSNAMEREFLVATVRVTGAWLAEETAALRDDVYRVLPLLMRAARDERRCLRFLLPALCHLSVEDPARAILLEEGIPALLTEYAQELWEAFRAEDRERAEEEEPQQATRAPEGETENSLATICGVQMNMIVLEAEKAATHEGFRELLQFALAALPDVDGKVRHLVLRGHLATLGLLLLRWRSFRSSESSATYRFLSASIRFLWDAFNVEDSQDGASLVVNYAYRGVWEQLKEMWYLGMQALSSLLPSMPWIGEFIVESGWSQEIATTLGKAGKSGLEGCVRTTYEDFLCCLVKCCDGAADDLKEHGALKMCGVHKMKELGRLLRRHVGPFDAAAASSSAMAALQP